MMCDRKVSGTVKTEIMQDNGKAGNDVWDEALAATKVQKRMMPVAEMRILRWSL